MRNDNSQPLMEKNEDCEIIVETINVKSIENEVVSCEICGPDGAGY